MDDILGFRIVCQSLHDAKSVVSNLEQVPMANKKDYVNTEHHAGTGYRAQHVIIRFDQPFQQKTSRVRFEVQIRTWYQHLWACWSENFGERAKEGFKFRSTGTDNDDETIAQLREVSKTISEWEDAFPNKNQKSLPTTGDLHNISVAWFNKKRKFLFDVFNQDASDAVNLLYRLESMKELEPILLVGVTEPNNVQNLLQETHPRFMRPMFWYPKYWLPNSPNR